MSKEPIDTILEELTQDLKQNPTPLVRYNSHTKNISIKYDFNYGEIPNIRLIISRDELKRWYDDDVFTGKLTFDIVKKYLSKNTAAKKKNDLEQYAEKDLMSFQEDMLHCIQHAIGYDPKFPGNIKTRKNEYDLDWWKKNKISNMAIRLYIYLFDEIRKKPKNQWPVYINNFLEEYHIDKEDLKQDFKLKYAVEDVMTSYFKIESIGYRFWQTFVTESPVSLTAVRKLKNINPENDPSLQELFKKFMS